MGATAKDGFGRDESIVESAAVTPESRRTLPYSEYSCAQVNSRSHKFFRILLQYLDGVCFCLRAVAVSSRANVSSGQLMQIQTDVAVSHASVPEPRLRRKLLSAKSPAGTVLRHRLGVVMGWPAVVGGHISVTTHVFYEQRARVMPIT